MAAGADLDGEPFEIRRDFDTVEFMYYGIGGVAFSIVYCAWICLVCSEINADEVQCSNRYLLKLQITENRY